LFDFLHANNALFSFDDSACSCCDHGRLRLHCEKSVSSDGLIWRCTNRRCTYRVSFRKHSFFSGSKLQIAQITKIIYFWAHRYPQEIVIYETGIGTHTAADFFNFLREVCSVVLQEQSEPIGGPGKFVEIDESQFGKRKYHRGKRVDGICVFGGIERDSHLPKCFFVPVEDRSAATPIHRLSNSGLNRALPSYRIVGKHTIHLKQKGIFTAQLITALNLSLTKGSTRIILRVAGTPSRNHCRDMEQQRLSTHLISPNIVFAENFLTTHRTNSWKR